MFFLEVDQNINETFLKKNQTNFIENSDEPSEKIKDENNKANVLEKENDSYCEETVEETIENNEANIFEKENYSYSEETPAEIIQDSISNASTRSPKDGDEINNSSYSNDGTDHSTSSDKQILFNVSKKDIDNKHKKKKYRRVRFDNYRTKIKIHFFRFMIDFINDYIKYSLCINNLIFRKISHIDIKNSSIKGNKRLIFATLREVLNSFSVSEKYRDKEKQNNVSMALLEKRKVSIDFLDMTLMEFFDTIYLSKNCELLKEQYGLKKGIPFYLFLENLKKKEKNLDFIHRLETTAEGFINYYISKKPKPLATLENKT